ncbi:Protein of unknown function [Anaerovirgula multivorans]|uniref:DUF2922 domain-containing protein n=1 Tax=Anaerovirgula multivorans TaxID=312168 RepID=A0A239EXA2_9FIRM|nr:DUF2922 domain-containing protein [Anaerovirgula multivorans]SNS49390.1 Protein of unknown function [Anaerovirgula multivorans]
MNRVLEMTFKKTDDKTAKLTIVNAREDITAAEVKAAMETILNDNVFIVGEEELGEIHGAKIIRTEEEELELV